MLDRATLLPNGNPTDRVIIFADAITHGATRLLSIRFADYAVESRQPVADSRSCRVRRTD